MTLIVNIHAEHIAFARQAILRKTLQSVTEGTDRVIIVSAGAISLGRRKIPGVFKKETPSEQQALAAIGQPHLIPLFNAVLAPKECAQILLTEEDIENPERRQNMLNTLEALLRYDYVPLVNGNDSVSEKGVMAGHNDALCQTMLDYIPNSRLVTLDPNRQSTGLELAASPCHSHEL